MASMVPSERLRRKLHEIVAGVGEEEDPTEAIGRLGARLILQQALEEELSEFSAASATSAAASRSRTEMATSG
jgi:hypothetical protein